LSRRCRLARFCLLCGSKKSRCVAGIGHIACDINGLKWSGRKDSKSRSRVATMPFSLWNLTAKQRCIRNLQGFPSLSQFPNCPASGQHSARIWFHWYPCSPQWFSSDASEPEMLPSTATLRYLVLVGTDFDSVAVVRPSGILDLSCLPRTTCMPDTAAAVSSRESNPASAIGD
jgi:hypothetical protein